MTSHGARTNLGATTTSRRQLISMVVALVFTLTACNQWWLTYDGSDPTTATTVVTPEADDAYVITANTGLEFDATALDTNSGGNLRLMFWPEAARVVRDQESCATWASQSRSLNQQGALLRQRTMADGSTRALTVTKNVFYGADWVFNFHTWDTTRTGAPYRQIGSVDLAPLLYGTPLPWHMCSRAVGNQLSVKVWTGTQPEPAWGDPDHGKSVTLDPAWVYQGKAGWYIGHLRPGDSARFANLSTHRYGPEDPAPTTTTAAPATAAPNTESTTTTAPAAGEEEVLVSAP